MPTKRKHSKGLVELFDLELQKRNKEFPALAKTGNMVQPKKYKEGDTNSFTKAVANYILLSTPYSNVVRINTQGQFDSSTGKYRKSGSTNGVSDIKATIHGISLNIEIKKGSDKLRPAQKTQMELELKAGGLFWVVYVGNFDSFADRFKILLNAISPKFIDFMKTLQKI